MSDTLIDPPVVPPVADPPVADPPIVADPPAGDPPASDPPIASEPPKPRRDARYIAQLNARLANEAEGRAAAERRAEAAEALLAAGKTPPDPAAPPAPRQAPPQDVNAAAEQLLAQREANQKRNAVVAAGRKEFGADAWAEKTEALHALGATSNPAFMAALMETDNPTRIVAELADDPDAVVELLQRPAPAMAARLGRMDARLGTPAKPALSGAPPPAPRVSGARVDGQYTMTDYPAGMSMAEWNKLADRDLPVHLGGRRKA